MWKVAGATILTIAGSTLATAQQPSPAERPHRANLTADDIAAFSDVRIAAFKAALKLTPAQEKNWPAVMRTAQAHPTRLRPPASARAFERRATSQVAPSSWRVNHSRSRGEWLVTA